jgi:hypothetical protein
VRLDFGSALFVNAPVSVANFIMSNGYLRGTGTLTLTGSAAWSGGGMIDTGSTVVAPGATLTTSNSADVTDQRTLEIAGTVNQAGFFGLGSAAVLSVRPGGTFNLSASIQGSSTALVNNQGLFVKTGGTGTIQMAFNNTGTLRVETGTLSFFRVYTQSAGTTFVAAGATLQANATPQANVQLNGGTLAGGGTVAGNVTGAGTVSPGTSPGRLTISGNLALLPGGALVVELNGTSAGTQYDQLRVTGTVLLGGALNLSVDHAPAVGDTFTILDNAGTGATQGTFAGLPQGATVTAGGTTFTISYAGGTGNDVVLTATTVTGPRVAAVGVNAGSAQRSMVTSLQVTFSTIVTIAPGAFTLTYLGGPAGIVGSTVGGFTVSTATIGGVTVATLNGFTGADTSAGSLVDGRYALRVAGSAITASGVPMAGDFIYADSGATTGSQLFRFYGDVTGDRFVKGDDFALFRSAFGTQSPDPNYIAAFDLNGDGFVNGADFALFRTNFGGNI